MKKICKTFFVFILLSMTCLCFSSVEVLAAASANTSVSADEAEVGGEVVVSITIKSKQSLGTYEIYVQYDSEKLVVSDENSDDLRGGGGRVVIVGGANTEEEKSHTYKIKFIAKKAGDANVYISGSAYYYDENTQEVVDMEVKTCETKVKISSPSKSSSDNTLSSLTLQTESATGKSWGVKLDPEFSPDVTEYNGTLTYDVNKVIVSATQSDPNAKVEVSGTRMDLGDNVTKITVTAEDGSTKEYIINLYKTTEIPLEETSKEQEETTTRPEHADKNIYIDALEKYLIVSFDDIDIPEGFEKSTFVYKENSVDAARGIAKDIILVYMADDEEMANGAFYIYDEKEDSFYKMTNIQTDKMMYTIIKTPDNFKIPKGFKKKKVKINKVNVDSWVLEGNDEFCLVYAMNYDGNTGLYVYDRNEGTMQRYMESVVKADGEEADTEVDNEGSEEVEQLYSTIDKLKREYKNDRDLKWKIILGISLVCIILVIMSGVLLKKLNSVEIIEEEEENDESEEIQEETEEPRQLKLDMAASANEMSSGALAANIEDIVREELGEEAHEENADESAKVDEEEDVEIQMVEPDEVKPEEAKEEPEFAKPEEKIEEPEFVQPAEMKIVSPEVFEQVSGIQNKEVHNASEDDFEIEFVEIDDDIK